MPKLVDKTLSLEVLEGQSWGNPKSAQSELAKRCMAASKIPLRDLTSAHLRLLIGQQFSLTYLLPMAIGLLETYPVLESGLYEGDLLSVVLKLDWSLPETKEYLPRVIALAKTAHLQMMHTAIVDMMQGHTPEELGLSEEAYEKSKRRAAAEIQIVPWAELVQFLEVHG